MTTATDAALAQLSLDAYSNVPVTLPTGFTPLDATSLPITLGAGESFSGGIYHNANAAALTTEATLDGKDTLVVAFRGSDDATDSLHDLRDINADYPLFEFADRGGGCGGGQRRYQQVVVTGEAQPRRLLRPALHAGHPDQPGGLTYHADTFGSAGAVLPPGGDARLTNFVIADDPAVFLGAHRAEIGEVLRADDTLADLAAQRAAEEFPGLTKQQALDSLPSLTVTTRFAATRSSCPATTRTCRPPPMSPVCRSWTPRAAPELYASAVATAAATPGHEILVPTAPQDNDGLALPFRTVYNSDQHDPQAAEAGAAAGAAGLGAGPRRRCPGRAERCLHQHPRRAGRHRPRPEHHLTTPRTGRAPVMVSSRSGLVESSVTGASTSSSMRRTYFTAAAGSSAQLRAPRVEAVQPSITS